MRSYLILAVACLSLFSCKKNDNNIPKSTGHKPNICLATGVDPQMKVQIYTTNQTYLTPDSTEGMVLRRYEKNNNFDLLIEETQPDSSLLTSGYDYELYMPVINKSVRISQIEFLQLTDSIMCNTPFYNQFVGALVFFDGTPAVYQLARRSYYGDYLLSIVY